MSVLNTLKSIKPPFWLANAQEACERLAYFGVKAVLPLMLVSTGTGGLGLSMTQKGIIFGLWAFIQCIVPMVSGGFSETFGYKKSLIVAFSINAFGYLIMANVLNIATLLGSTSLNPTMNFWIMLLAACTIGLGTAIFKPPVQGIVAKSLNEKTSSFGFGLFYWVVNVGGMLAPMVAASLRGNDVNPTWHHVFYGALFVTLFNLVITLLFFKEPERTQEEIEKNKGESAGKVFIKTLKTLWDDKNMLIFLLIVSGFWLMFMQLWDLLPNFIMDWVDARDVGNFLQQIPFIKSLDWYNSDHSLKPEMIINIDSITIVLFVLPLSALFARFKMMTALITGMVISVIGFILGGMTTSGAICSLAIFIFAIGEIICSPKFNEYIGMTAPADKKAIYMGYSNIPFAFGWAAGNFLSGPLYDIFSSKLKIGQAWLSNHGVTSILPKDLDVNNAREFLMSDKVGMSEADLPKLTNYKGLDLEHLKNVLADKQLSFSDACNKTITEATNAANQYKECLSSGIRNLQQKGEICQTSLQKLTESSQSVNDCLVQDAQKVINNYDLNNLLTIIQNKNISEIPVDYCSMDCVTSHVQTIAKVSDPYAISGILWNSSTPWVIWIILGSIGVISMAGMIAFYFKSGMSKQDDAKRSAAEENAEDKADKTEDKSDKTEDKSDKTEDKSDKTEDKEN